MQSRNHENDKFPLGENPTSRCPPLRQLQGLVDQYCGNPITPIHEAIREIRLQILMLNWRGAVRWARSADPSERNTDSAADRRGSYLLSSVGESCRESQTRKGRGFKSHRA